MVSEFVLLPPEINSMKLYAGEGSRSLVAAAAAWDALAVDLYSAAGMFGRATSGLAGGSWQGVASAAMLRVAASYAGWLSAVAAQAEHAAGLVRTAADAFEGRGRHRTSGDGRRQPRSAGVAGRLEPVRSKRPGDLGR